MPRKNGNKIIKADKNEGYNEFLNNHLIDKQGDLGAYYAKAVSTGKIGFLEQFQQTFKVSNNANVTQPAKLTPEEKNYIDFRIASMKKIQQLELDKNDPKKLAKRELPDLVHEGSYICLDIPHHQHQTTGNGCWSVSMSVMLGSRGVNLTQQEVRSFRPNLSVQDENTLYSSHTAFVAGQHFWYENSDLQLLGKDTQGNVFQFAELIQKTVPNTGVHNVVYEDPGSHFNEVKKELMDTIKHSIINYRSPISFLSGGRNGGHYRTIVGFDEKNGMVAIEDSASQDGKIDYISIDSIIRTSKLELTWMEPLTVDRDGAVHGIPDKFQGVTYEKGKLIPGPGYDELPGIMHVDNKPLRAFHDDNHPNTIGKNESYMLPSQLVLDEAVKNKQHWNGIKPSEWNRDEEHTVETPGDPIINSSKAMNSRLVAITTGANFARLLAIATKNNIPITLESQSNLQYEREISKFLANYYVIDKNRSGYEEAWRLLDSLQKISAGLKSVDLSGNQSMQEFSELIEDDVRTLKQVFETALRERTKGELQQGTRTIMPVPNPSKVEIDRHYNDLLNEIKVDSSKKKLNLNPNHSPNGDQFVKNRISQQTANWQNMINELPEEDVVKLSDVTEQLANENAHAVSDYDRLQQERREQIRLREEEERKRLDELKKRQDELKKRQDEENRRREEEEKKRQDEENRRREEEEKKRQDEENRRREEEEKKRQEKENHREEEEEKKHLDDEEKKSLDDVSSQEEEQKSEGEKEIRDSGDRKFSILIDDEDDDTPRNSAGMDGDDNPDEENLLDEFGLGNFLWNIGKPNPKVKEKELDQGEIKIEERDSLSQDKEAHDEEKPEQEVNPWDLRYVKLKDENPVCIELPSGNSDWLPSEQYAATFSTQLKQNMLDKNRTYEGMQVTDGTNILFHYLETAKEMHSDGYLPTQLNPEKLETLIWLNGHAKNQLLHQAEREKMGNLEMTGRLKQMADILDADMEIYTAIKANQEGLKGKTFDEAVLEAKKACLADQKYANRPETAKLQERIEAFEDTAEARIDGQNQAAYDKVKAELEQVDNGCWLDMWKFNNNVVNQTGSDEFTRLKNALDVITADRSRSYAELEERLKEVRDAAQNYMNRKDEHWYNKELVAEEKRGHRLTDKGQARYDLAKKICASATAGLAGLQAGRNVLEKIDHQTVPESANLYRQIQHPVQGHLFMKAVVDINENLKKDLETSLFDANMNFKRTAFTKYIILNNMIKENARATVERLTERELNGFAEHLGNTRSMDWLVAALPWDVKDLETVSKMAKYCESQAKDLNKMNKMNAVEAKAYCKALSTELEQRNQKTGEPDFTSRVLDCKLMQAQMKLEEIEAVEHFHALENVVMTRDAEWQIMNKEIQAVQNQKAEEKPVEKQNPDQKQQDKLNNDQKNNEDKKLNNPGGQGIGI